MSARVGVTPVRTDPDKHAGVFMHTFAPTHTRVRAHTEPCDKLEKCVRCPNTQNSALSMFAKTLIYLCTYLFQLCYHTPPGKKNVQAAETPPFRQLIVKSILLSTYFFLILWAEESVVRAVGRGG